MLRKFYQNIFSLFFVLLTVLGWYYGQIQQYVYSDSISDYTFIHSYSNGSSAINNATFTFLRGDRPSNICGNFHPRYRKIKANLSENENENDESLDSSSPDDVLILRQSFWRFISALVTATHNRQSSVSFSHYSKHLKLLFDDLYIQYRVIRL
jgi:hypothetical protein